MRDADRLVAIAALAGTSRKVPGIGRGPRALGGWRAICCGVGMKLPLRASLPGLTQRLTVWGSGFGACGARWAQLVVGLSVSGCLSQSYEVSVAELERIVELPAEQRGDRIRVTQQTSFGNDIGEQEVSALVLDPTDWGTFDGHYHHHDHHHHRRHHRHDQASGDDGQDDDSAEGAAAEALAAAVVVAAVASTAALSVGVTEGLRYDGWMEAPASHPVLLIDQAGGRSWSRLEELTRGDLNDLERAVLPELGGTLEPLQRAPLNRQGFAYQLEFGTEAAPSSVGEAWQGVAGRLGLGYMPHQRYGLLLGAAFASARAPGDDDAGLLHPELMFEYRVFLQTEYWPLAWRRLHAGPYVELGHAWALRDEASSSVAAQGLFLGGGVAVQLDWTTRLAVTLRLGASALPSIGPGAPVAADGRRFSPALTLGVSIY